MAENIEKAIGENMMESAESEKREETQKRDKEQGKE